MVEIRIERPGGDDEVELGVNTQVCDPDVEFAHPSGTEAEKSDLKWTMATGHGPSSYGKCADGSDLLL